MRLVGNLAAGLEFEPVSDGEPPGPPTHAVARLEDDDVRPRLLEAPGRRQAGEAGANDRDPLSYQSPPSATVRASPLIPLASSLARKAMVAAISSGASTRPAG